MREVMVRALFQLSELEVKDLYEISNQYWPDVPEYTEIRRQYPWWLVKTEHGLIKVGWRKKVISIDWSDSSLRQEVTKDEVTSDKSFVHAWTYAKAVEYLTELGRLLSEAKAEALAQPTA